MPRNHLDEASITGTGFKKCMPMNFSGRSVEAPSLVIEIEEVLVAISASGRNGVSA